MKVDKTLVASAALHVLVIGGSLITFSSRALEQVEESLPVEVISADQLAKVTAGVRTGSAASKAPLVEKVAEAKPVDDHQGKVTEKPPVKTEAAPPPPPPAQEKPVEKKPEPPKPVAEAKPAPKPEPKPEPKPAEKKPEPPKVDPIAEALKKEEAKKLPPKPVEAAKPPPPRPRPPETAKVAPKAPPQQQKPAERSFDSSKIAALLDKREPTRRAATGETPSSTAALGLAHGRSADNSATWGSMFKSQVERCWKKPYGSVDPKKMEVEFSIRLNREGNLEAPPRILNASSDPGQRVFQESALRAIIECQPYKLPPAFFNEWTYFAPVFADDMS